MSRRKQRTPSLFDQDRHTLEFSPGQLVLAICTVLLLGLVCFLAGVVVGRYDDSYTDASLFADLPREEEMAQPTDEETEPQTDEGEGFQVSPRPLARDSGEGPRMVDLPAPSANDLNADEDAPSPPPEETEETPKDTHEEPEEPAKDDAEDAPEDEPHFEPFSPTDDLTAGDVLDMTPEGGPYTIQVISYVADDRDMAEDYAQYIEEETGYEPTLAVSEDGAYIRVLLGAFPDQETARAAQEKLQELAEFEDSFVRRRANAT